MRLDIRVFFIAASLALAATASAADTNREPDVLPIEAKPSLQRVPAVPPRGLSALRDEEAQAAAERIFDDLKARYAAGKPIRLREVEGRGLALVADIRLMPLDKNSYQRRVAAREITRGDVQVDGATGGLLLKVIQILPEVPGGRGKLTEVVPSKLTKRFRVIAAEETLAGEEDGLLSR